MTHATSRRRSALPALERSRVNAGCRESVLAVVGDLVLGEPGVAAGVVPHDESVLAGFAGAVAPAGVGDAGIACRVGDRPGGWPGREGADGSPAGVDEHQPVDVAGAASTMRILTSTTRAVRPRFTFPAGSVSHSRRNASQLASCHRCAGSTGPKWMWPESDSAGFTCRFTTKRSDGDRPAFVAVAGSMASSPTRHRYTSASNADTVWRSAGSASSPWRSANNRSPAARNALSTIAPSDAGPEARSCHTSVSSNHDAHDDRTGSPGSTGGSGSASSGFDGSGSPDGSGFALGTPRSAWRSCDTVALRANSTAIAASCGDSDAFAITAT